MEIKAEIREEIKAEIREEIKVEIQIKVGEDGAKVVKVIKEHSFQDKDGNKMVREDLLQAKEDKEVIFQERFQGRSHLTMT